MFNLEPLKLVLALNRTKKISRATSEHGRSNILFHASLGCFDLKLDTCLGICFGLLDWSDYSTHVHVPLQSKNESPAPPNLLTDLFVFALLLLEPRSILFHDLCSFSAHLPSRGVLLACRVDLSVTSAYVVDGALPLPYQILPLLVQSTEFFGRAVEFNL